ncbi:MAG TPA: phosphate/phosphite/phosphonate ABC transporter substrate-binding protein [Ignavibacteria bacterium]|nr:phosphate/phosphite/phosphonate ABC transporter substrate-binding protein [Ignavibacteria bacterium]
MKSPVTTVILFILFLFLNYVMFTQSTEKQEYYDAIFGFVPSENSDVVQTNADNLAAMIKKETGLNVKIFISTSYNTLIEAMKSKQVDFATFPPFAFTEAEKIAGAELLLKTTRQGKDYYFSAIIVRKDSGIESIQDLRGKSIAWAQPTSAGGYIFPKADLIKKGILKNDNDKTFFSEELNAGGHDAVVLSVFNKKVDAGATFANDNENISGAWDRYLKDSADVKMIKAIYYTEKIPMDVFTVRSDYKTVNPEKTEKIVQFLLNITKTEEGKQIIKSFDRESFVRANSEEYDIVREAGKILNVQPEK